MTRRVLAIVTSFALATASVTPALAAPKKAKGPTEEELQAFLADKPDAARPSFRMSVTDGARNEVLYLMRAGLASMDARDFASAAAAFDGALDKIETVYASNPAADKARSKFVKEAIKDYKGEAYER